MTPVPHTKPAIQTEEPDRVQKLGCPHPGSEFEEIALSWTVDELKERRAECLDTYTCAMALFVCSTTYIEQNGVRVFIQVIRCRLS